MLEEHVDPDTLAAFSENTLTESERAALFAHLGECERCRQWLSVHAAVQDGCAAPGRLSSVPAYLRTAAGIACVFAALWLFIRAGEHPRPAALSNPPAAVEVEAAAKTDVETLPLAPLKPARHPVRFAKRSAANRSVAELLAPPSTPWQHVTFRTFGAGFDSTPQARPPALSGPWAFTRLDSRMNFDFSAAASTNNHVSVRTALGERWLAVNVWPSAGSP